MDVKLDVVLTDNPDELVLIVEKCKADLTAACFSMFGRAEFVSCDVYVTEKLAEYFKLSSFYKPYVQKQNEYDTLPKEDVTKRRRVRYIPSNSSEPVASFSSFDLHKDFLLMDENIRVVVTFDVHCKAATKKTYYGNIRVVF